MAWIGRRRARNGQRLLKGYNTSIPCGNTGAQMGGWSESEIKTVDDFKGRKFRIGGWAARVGQARRGAAAIGGADIYPRSRRARSTPPNGSGLMTTRSWASTRLQVLLLPGLVGGQPRSGPTSTSTAGTSCRRAIRRRSEPPRRYLGLGPRGIRRHNPQALRRLIANGTELRHFARADHGGRFKASPRAVPRASAQERAIQEDLRAWSDYLDQEDEWYPRRRKQHSKFRYGQVAAQTDAVNRRRPTSKLTGGPAVLAGPAPRNGCCSD